VLILYVHLKAGNIMQSRLTVSKLFVYERSNSSLYWAHWVQFMRQWAVCNRMMGLMFDHI
jgi:hypothetical protein